MSARAGAPGAPLRAARRRAGSSRRALSPAGARKVGAMVPELLAEPIHGRNLAWFANITCGGTIDEWCEGASLSGAGGPHANKQLAMRVRAESLAEACLDAHVPRHLAACIGAHPQERACARFDHANCGILCGRARALVSCPGVLPWRA